MQKFYVGVKGILRKDAKILLLQKAHPEFWEAPGGRIDQKENSPKEALIRELSEELPGIKDILIGELLGISQEPFFYPDGTGLLLLYYEVKAFLPDSLKLSSEHNAYKWIDKADSLKGIRSEVLKDLISTSS